MDNNNLTNSGFDTRAFRDALGTFGTGVCVVTTLDGEGEGRGITVNSFSSVSLDPPLILWCIDEASDRYDLFVDAPNFALNILASDQDEIATKFAREPESRILKDGSASPVIEGALAVLQCETAWRQKAGDHVVIFGRVMCFTSVDGDGLGYFRGKYVRNAIAEA